MINGNITEFIDKLYLGEELMFEYNGSDYFLQGWNEDSKAVMVLDCYTQQPFSQYIWKSEKQTMHECAEEFIDAKIWDKKTFIQVQNQITWKD